MSNTNVFNDNILTTKVKIQPRNLNKNYHQYILNKLQKQYEGKFSKFGLIKEGTIDLLSVSLGSLEQNSFEGNILFNVSFNSKICNPVIGNILLCKVVNTNNFGILCTAEDNNKSIIDIIIPKKSIAIQSDIDLTNIKIGMNVYVEIIGRKPILNDTKIKCIGKIIKTDNRSKVKPNLNTENIEEDDDIIKEEIDIEYDDDDIINDDDEDDDDDDDVINEEEEDDEDEIDDLEGGSDYDSVLSSDSDSDAATLDN